MYIGVAVQKPLPWETLKMKKRRTLKKKKKKKKKKQKKYKSKLQQNQSKTFPLTSVFHYTHYIQGHLTSMYQTANPSVWLPSMYLFVLFL